MFGIGGHELLLILLVALVVFGARRLPEIGSGLGRAIKNFKQATNEPEEIDISSKKSTTAESSAASSTATAEKTNG